MTLRETGHDSPQKDQVVWQGYLVVFSRPFCSVLMWNFPRIQVVQLDYLNPILGRPTGLFLEVRSPRGWDYAICRALGK